MEERKKLAAGGQAAIDASTDTLIQLAKLVDPAARAVREVMEKQVTEVEPQAYAQISKALFEIEGPSRYPDATFTLRLSYGTVKGYEENGKQAAAHHPHGRGLRAANKHGNKAPVELPKSWHDKRSQIGAETPFNFVSTNDIIGGNSGSPVVNRKGELVGLIFDGNIQSLVGTSSTTKRRTGRFGQLGGDQRGLRKIYNAGGAGGSVGEIALGIFRADVVY